MRGQNLKSIRLFALLTIPLLLLSSRAFAESSCLAQNRVQSMEEFSEALDLASCEPLPVGKSMIVNQSPSESPTGVPASYILHRKSTTHFQLEFNLNFLETKITRLASRAIGVIDSEAEKEMRTHVETCLRRAGPSLLGPNGESLELVLTPSQPAPTADQKQIARVIDITDAGSRSHSRGYARDISCAAVVHEVFHLAGLVDEYVERDPAIKVNCRAPGMSDSIMNDGNPASPSHFALVSGHTCSCKVPGCETHELTSACNGSQVVKNEFAVEINDDMADENHLRAILAPIRSGFGAMGETPPMHIEIKSIVRFNNRPKNSVLYPAHFRSMTRPGCKKANERYYTCSHLAYQASARGLFGIGAKTCPAAPDYCRNGQWLR